MASDAQISRDDLITVINDIAWRYPDDAPSLADSLLHHYRIQGKVLHPVTLEEVAAPAPAVDRHWREACRLAARDGWSPFGTHVNHPGVELEFDGADESGEPLWERPVRSTVDRDAAVQLLAERYRTRWGYAEMNDQCMERAADWLADYDALLATGYVRTGPVPDRAEVEAVLAEDIVIAAADALRRQGVVSPISDTMPIFNDAAEIVDWVLPEEVAAGLLRGTDSAGGER